ncbi:hypothetical protein ACX6XY_15955 [Streptomyces sp. O3]
MGPGGPRGAPTPGRGRHGGQRNGLPGGPTPDWAALAEASEARARRRKLLIISCGTLATAAVASIVAAAVVSANSGADATGKPRGSLPTSEALPSSTTSAAPSFAETKPPPPPDPKEFISSADKDKAPLSADALFPGTEYAKGSTVYKKGRTSTAKGCADATQGPLGSVLTENECEKLFRASYTSDGLAVTVGIAVFATERQATQAKEQSDKGYISVLSGSGVPAFCQTSVCRTTTNSYGRYAYFTITGFTSGKNVTTSDEKAYAVGDDLASFAFQQIHHRGEAQARAAVNG